MKNIHILPTDKPSRLHYFKANKAGYYLYPNNELVVPKNPNCINQNIYITSDEEIKEGDYFIAYSVTIDKKPYISCASEYKERKKEKGKIILTTDVDLIKDGVQAIDDEFLEWFVKNPSCEEVEIEKVSVMNDRFILNYEIIIPKEEPCEHFTPTIGCIKDVCSCNKEPKQETLEEVGTYQQELFNYLHDLGVIALQSEMQEIERIVLSMQQERMYSETDIVLILSKFRDMKMIAFCEWFEQFKKK